MKLLCNSTYCITAISLLLSPSLALANWQAEFPENAEIIEVSTPYYKMAGWEEACSGGFECRSFLNQFTSALSENSVLENMREFDALSKGFDETDAEEANEECSNGYTRQEMADAFVEKSLHIAKLKSTWGYYLNIEATVVTTYYKNTILGGGYRTVMGGLLTYLGDSTSERLKKEYEQGMATCD
ncbi:hypothetical protein BK026_02605 [Alteromonas sp. V450]|uniref:hypothetical protein n=1 Tax=Alteromonas sp. V450 TaxID=1912139 RepID=UPI0008FF762D|nr:hypothetical protein [Alteromonas sp. V450]OJF67760.1 hypothetical protein BK026_02605 [Alteromonas sp. V450]